MVLGMTRQWNWLCIVAVLRSMGFSRSLSFHDITVYSIHTRRKEEERDRERGEEGNEIDI